VIKMRRAQLSFGDGLIHDEVEDLREDWMTYANQVLDDEQLVATVYDALAKRHPHSRCRGRQGTPAEVVLRLLILKHVRNWSYGVLEREVRANLVYRDFSRVGSAKMPDAKTMGRWGLALGPQAIKQIHERIVQIAQAEEVTEGRRMRVDTTVTETNIHYPTDSSLLADGVRVLIRTMKKITKIAGETGAKLRDHSRSVKLRALEIARAARAKGKQSKQKLGARCRANLLWRQPDISGFSVRCSSRAACQNFSRRVGNGNLTGVPAGDIGYAGMIGNDRYGTVFADRIARAQPALAGLAQLARRKSSGRLGSLNWTEKFSPSRRRRKMKRPPTKATSLGQLVPSPRARGFDRLN
jgi:Transposase domain (DUF772)